jgi:bifunctional DNA-binding transcriptional regulator/antitoxin component of YhaV-PrlF toxin-antitoxin module
MKISRSGQITIPRELQERFGFLPDTEVELIPEKGGLKLVRPGHDAKTPTLMSGKDLIEHMRGRGTGRLSTDEIMEITRGELK